MFRTKKLKCYNELFDLVLIVGGKKKKKKSIVCIRLISLSNDVSNRIWVSYATNSNNNQRESRNIHVLPCRFFFVCGLSRAVSSTMSTKLFLPYKMEKKKKKVAPESRSEDLRKKKKYMKTSTTKQKLKH